MRNFFLGFILASALAMGGFWVLTHDRQVEQGTALYLCPMHPTYTSDRPGNCPICGMDLVAAEQASDPGAAPAPASEPTAYRCPIHPEYTADKPGNCPLCGIRLDPIEAEAGPAHEHGQTSPPIPGYAEVHLTAQKQQLMGIALEKARIADLSQTLRTVGRIAFDETRIHHVHTKFSGYIEELYADYVGMQVEQGTPLFSIYSPELLATQKEYLLALRASREVPSLSAGYSPLEIDLLGAARRRLALWDINEEQLEQLERSGQPIRSLVIHSPVGGYVIRKTALAGLQVGPSDHLYDIVDLSKVWVLADLYEANLLLVRVGQGAEVSLPYQPGRTLKGTVTFIDPVLEPSTRTVKVRIELPNPEGMLKPEMYADVAFHAGAGRGVVVPENAVISTGERDLVFVARPDGVYEPREVTLGVRVGSEYHVKSGLSEGELVVTRANFLLDSESRLRAALGEKRSVTPQHSH